LASVCFFWDALQILPRTQTKRRDLANLRARFLGISPPIGNKAVNSVRCRVSSLARAINIRGLKILVLRGGALGDLILTLPVLDEIRSSFPESFIEVWGIQPQAGLIQSVDRVDRLDALEVAPLFVAEPIPPVLRGRLREFDLAISFLGDPGGVVAKNLASAGVRRVITGWPAKKPTIHAVYQLASVLEPLGLNLRDPVPRLTIVRSQSEKPLLGFHPGSGCCAKNWPLECWNEFLRRIGSKFERLLLIGGEADDEVVHAMQLSWKGPAFETAIRRNLWELAQMLGRCSIFIGHDTGVTHLAAAVQTPTVALFGPTSPDVWRPLGEHVKVIWSREERMDAIGVGTVVDAVSSSFLSES
jgi:heptosyltransferase-3